MMTIVFRVHLTGFVLLSYAVLIASMSVQKLTVNSSQPTQETKSSSMPESFNEANGAGIMHTRGVGSARRFNNTLSLHNLFRRDVDPPAANMPKLGWSSYLARLAELWSRHCIVGYGLPLTLNPLTYSGQILQNIWAGGRNGSIEDALSSWFKEGNYYNFKTRACYRANGCKNYLTMVSAYVHEVGCGLSYCNDDVIVVCYYGARNYKSHELLYTPGKPCSQCGAFEWCDSGLCRSSSDNERKGDTVETKCVYNNINLESNDVILNAVSVEDESHLKRPRRHTTEDTQAACDALYFPLMVFVIILIVVVGIGFLIGIFYMLGHVCRDRCCSDLCTSTSDDGSCLGCCNSSEGSSSGTSETRGRSLCCIGVCRLKCCKTGSVKPEEEGYSTTESIPLDPEEIDEPHDEPGGSDSPDANVLGPAHVSKQVDVECVNAAVQVDVPDPVPAATQFDVPDPIHAATQVDVEYRAVCTNTDEPPATIDRSTCIKDLLHTSDVAVQVDEEDDTTTDSGGSDDTSDPSGCSSHSDKLTDPIDSSQGVCLVHNCHTCDLHRRDQRQVDKLKTDNIRKLIKASKNKNLAPGTYII
ncbi:uncharacterized protein LOC117295946 isoform X2 [Asterias rubens]|uniref:uncharacterized protein LOC117295946 isoform X2 n=1 Tax=Asterias rubens TaxID=7604 RepID=UPI0014559825|nr:uncharacterized protein LOC117295946 isoform X2 [Asterias rubens]